MTDSDRDARFLREIVLRNILSYGPDSDPIPLCNLNVLIGPNGSGKSNLIEAIALLRATPLLEDGLGDVIRKGGSVGEWVWKGRPEAPASIEAIVANPAGNQDLRHVFALRAEGQAIRLADESIENKDPVAGKPKPYLFYDFDRGHPVLNVKGKERRLSREHVDLDSSILAQRRDPEQYPEITYLAQAYQGIRIYRDWTFGRGAAYRGKQPADMRSTRLEEDFSNLGMFLNRLRRTPKAKDTLLTALRDIYDGIRDFDVSIEANTVQVFFTEGDFTIPSTRLSDGTMRYLCLLAILCEPDPPPLICIEEPELGLHPDLIPKIGDLLFIAAERTQLIVTTHSDILVDAMTERPEVVLVCEKYDAQSVLGRLDTERLAVWLEKYRLGQLWTRGQLGGTRW